MINIQDNLQNHPDPGSVQKAWHGQHFTNGSSFPLHLPMWTRLNLQFQGGNTIGADEWWWNTRVNIHGDDSWDNGNHPWGYNFYGFKCHAPYAMDLACDFFKPARRAQWGDPKARQLFQCVDVVSKSNGLKWFILIWIYIYTHVFILYIYVYICIHICIYTYIHICTYIDIHILYIYTYRHSILYLIGMI